MDTSSHKSTTELFGGHRTWEASDWTASDDRVRGGKSQSYLDPTDGGKAAHFHGNLDIKTLGGAGFASQRTTGKGKGWDLSGFDGIRIDLGKADGKTYTLILKDNNLLPPREDGREQATISWESDFTTTKATSGISAGITTIPWSSFKPTYRGREKKDADPLDAAEIKRLSVMMRSFFGEQEGDFSVCINSISAYKAARKDATSRSHDTRDVEGAKIEDYAQGERYTSPWWRTLAMFGLATGLTFFVVRTLYRRLP